MLIHAPAMAEPPAMQHQGMHEEATAALAEGQIVSIDEKALRLTLKHGEIQSLGMGPMTMAFGVRDAAQLTGLHVGDKIRFRAEKAGDDYVITQIEKP
jgi:Cu/Ag efflux protein CusF